MKEINGAVASGVLLDGRYKLLRPLSSDGGTADVWLALDTLTIDEVYDGDSDEISADEESGIKVAIKIYRPKNALDLGEQRFREEFKIVFNCHHTNLVQPINFSIFEGIPYLVLPYCQRGSSESLQGRINNADELWRYIADVSAGLAYLHAFNPTIVHHDIKPANVLIDDGGNYAITDFGISSHSGINTDGYDQTQSGTLAYMAPERFKDEYESTPESDIWSFGATLYELVTGKVPFGENGGCWQLETNTNSPAIAEDIPSDIKRLIADCLSADVSKRPSAATINKAAAQKRYPLKSKKPLLIGGAALAAIILLALILIPEKKNTDERSIVPSNEERYEKAIALISAPDAPSLRLGLSMLDSLGSIGYVPALYEQAFTYGWYADSASVARKELLGLELYPAGTDEEFLPKSKQINIKAIGLFTKIEELADPAYPDINAEALYRLACYYVNPNDVFQYDIDRAKVLLTQARDWAQKGTNAALKKKIDRGFEHLNN